LHFELSSLWYDQNIFRGIGFACIDQVI
jgi:hypothetical protein